jgi:hypothetical protein
MALVRCRERESLQGPVQGHLVPGRALFENAFLNIGISPAPWNMDYQRRLVLYRFAPSFIGYGRAYTNDQPPRWPASYYEVRRCIAVNGAREGSLLASASGDR